MAWNKSSIVRTKLRQVWKKSFSYKLSVILLIIFTGLAACAPHIANKVPLYCSYAGKTYFPTLQGLSIIKDQASGNLISDWEKLSFDRVIWPIIPYDSSPDLYHKNFSPFGKQITQNYGGNTSSQRLGLRNRHWLGSNSKGQDILAVIIHGSRRSLLAAVFTMFIASILGILLGSWAGYYQDDKLSISRGALFFLVPGVIFAWFYGFYLRSHALSHTDESLSLLIIQFLFSLAIFFGILWLFYRLGTALSRGEFLSAKILVPVDSFISRLMEILQSLPSLLLILSVSAFFQIKTLWFVMFVIALISWISIARVIRGEMLSISQRNYVHASQALGYSPLRILFKHMLPNSLAAIWPLIAFGIGASILMESTLSYLSLIENSQDSWGALLTEGKSVREAWWIALFPGIAIFLCVYSFNILGENIRDILDPRSH